MICEQLLVVWVFSVEFLVKILEGVSSTLWSMLGEKFLVVWVLGMEFLSKAGEGSLRRGPK